MPFHKIDIESLDPFQRMDLADALYDSAIAEMEQQWSHLSAPQIEPLDCDVGRSTTFAKEIAA